MKIDNEKEQKIDMAKDILDFWYTTEFLYQKSFEFPKKCELKKCNPYVDCKEFQNEKGVYEKRILRCGKELSFNSDFIRGFMQHDDGEYTKKEDETTEFALADDADVYVCFGSVSREDIRQKLHQISLLDDNAETKTNGNICVLGLKVDREGRYKKKTLTISPLIWGTRKMCENNVALTKEEYNNTIAELEKLLMDSEIDAGNSIDSNRLESICSMVIGELGLSYKSEWMVKYSRYQTMEVYNERVESEEDITNLFLSYFTNDLEMIRGNLDNNAEDVFLDYVTGEKYSQEDNNFTDKRIDIRKKNDFKNFLKITDYPYGKWFSKYTPNIMQQVAIDIAVKNQKSNEKTIFSVNGPPGTGKTTLLQELVASNIVKRANVICNRVLVGGQVFEEKHFNDGIENDNGYSKYYPHFFSLLYGLDGFGMLVAANNNAAAENISKELPSMKKLKKDNDESSTIFDFFKCGTLVKKMVFEDGCTKPKEKEVNDIYFSSLFGDDLDSVSEWGVVSAALGKHENIKDFCRNILRPLLKYYYNSNKLIEDHQKNLKGAVKNFKAKYLEVIKILKEVTYTKKLSDEVWNLNKDKKMLYQLKEKCEDEKNKLQERQKELESNLAESRTVVEARKKQQMDSVEFDIGFLNSEKRKLHFFNFIKKGRLLKRIENKNEIKRRLNVGEQKYDVENENDKDFILYCDMVSKCEQNSKVFSEALKMFEIACLKCDKNDGLLSSSSQKYNEYYKRYAKYCEKQNLFVQYINVEDADFQDSNPCGVDEFDRDREELLYYALQVHKEFVLSSKECRSNLHNLAHLWGLSSKSEGSFEEKMSERDKKDSFIHLFNTLFLLVPVLSTTFASAERFLKYIEQPNSIDTLIIDEAGQATPQAAVGLLWRCKHTIVVGDPLQVEPVVTDETTMITDVLKKNNEKISDYTKVSLSVQKFADNINNYGSYINESWVGCPLVVHRRCIEPMFSISNALSYGNTMISRTTIPSEPRADTFYDKTSWYNIGGSEESVGKGEKKNHFIKKQGERVIEIMKEILEKNKEEKLKELFIISPFTTVAYAMKEMINKNQELCTAFKRSESLKNWTESNCSTVHKFQGREANEVIFLLGCDSNSGGAIKWVNSHIINVAVTRAKYRLYIIGDRDVWSENESINEYVYKKICHSKVNPQ